MNDRNYEALRMEDGTKLDCNRISTIGRERVEQILHEVSQLSDFEKLYLYVQLPTGSRSSQSTTNFYPLLGKKSHSQVGHTYAWIRGHLVEDRDISLPKQEVYNEYKAYFEAQSLEPLCTADFGKVMKHVFPGVRARRLGERGKSRYCYSGLSRKIKTEPPILEDLGINCHFSGQQSKKLSQLRLLLDDSCPVSPSPADTLLDSGVSSVATSPRERPASGPGVFSYYQQNREKAFGDTQEFTARIRSQSAPIEHLTGSVLNPTTAALADDFLAGNGIEFDEVFNNMDLLVGPTD